MQWKACAQLVSACYTDLIQSVCQTLLTDLLTLKISALVHLNSSAVGDETWILQAHIKVKVRAHGQFWNLLTVRFK